MTSDTTFKDGFGRPGRGRHIDEHYEAEVIARFGETLAPLIDRFGYEGIESIGLLVGKITQDDAPAALELLEQSPAIVEALHETGGAAGAAGLRTGQPDCPLRFHVSPSRLW